MPYSARLEPEPRERAREALFLCCAFYWHCRMPDGSREWLCLVSSREWLCPVVQRHFLRKWRRRGFLRQRLRPYYGGPRQKAHDGGKKVDEGREKRED